MIVTTTEIRVRYAETDMMGIAYHGNYFTWFEIGRIHLLEEVGIPYRDIEKEGYRLPVLEAKAKFLCSTQFDDKVYIKTIMREKPKPRLRIEYELFCDDVLLCTGHTRHAFINTKGKPVRPPKKFICCIDPFFRVS